MSGKIDFTRIAADALSRADYLLPQWLPGGRFEGQEFKCGSVAGEQGDSLNFNISKGVGADFASGEKFGDMIDLYAAIKKIEVKQAALELAEICGTPPPDNVVRLQPKPRTKKPSSDEIPLVPVPADAPEPLAAFPKKNAKGIWQDHYISHFWAYRTVDNVLLGYACRIDRGHGKKDFTFQRWAFGRWAFKHAPRGQRPVYGQEFLNLPENLKRQVIIVEGEKTADAARKLFKKAVVLTWPGGSNHVTYADWSVVNNRTVYLWPDHDEPGWKAMTELAEILGKNDCKVKFIEPGHDLPEGW
ncbi:MAG TPA: DUF6371 domain-containing protein, partial [Candidatus Sulfotelmatobacter sp.]|nr:DUF6371 domain-containing protein [Candidatus Sulfotelmatobacter sp.]